MTHLSGLFAKECRMEAELLLELDHLAVRQGAAKLPSERVIFHGSSKFRSDTPNYFFTPRTVSFATLATRNLSTVFGRNPDLLFYPRIKAVRAFLFCFASLPKPD